MFDEILKTKIDFKHEDFRNFSNIGNTVFFFIILFIFYNLAFIIYKQDDKIKAIIFLILFTFLILIIINQKLKTNNNFSKKIVDVKNIINDVNSGDIVLFRTYKLTEFGNVINFLTPFVQNTYFTHIGMIYKDKSGKVYILESNGETFYCDISKIYKKGVCFMDFVKRINNDTNNRIHIIKSNIHTFLDHDKFEQTVFKYKNYKFFENGVYCLNLITKIFQENNLMKKDNLLPYIFEDVIDSKYYYKDIKFEEPITIKEYNEADNKLTE